MNKVVVKKQCLFDRSFDRAITTHYISFIGNINNLISTRFIGVFNSKIYITLTKKGGCFDWSIILKEVWNWHKCNFMSGFRYDAVYKTCNISFSSNFFLLILCLLRVIACPDGISRCKIHLQNTWLFQKNYDLI